VFPVLTSNPRRCGHTEPLGGVELLFKINSNGNLIARYEYEACVNNRDPESSLHMGASETSGLVRVAPGAKLPVGQGRASRPILIFRECIWMHIFFLNNLSDHVFKNGLRIKKLYMF
jgi:hypothetical protein